MRMQKLGELADPADDGVVNYDADFREWGDPYWFQVVIGRFGKPAAGYRFPGFYGPNYDWTPDQDHAATAMLTLQSMLMQTALDLSAPGNAGSAGKILLLPAWPREWKVHFKLHAPGQTRVEGEVKDGKVIKLVVTPSARQADILL